MKKSLLLTLLLLSIATASAFAAEEVTPVSPTTGWGPAVVGDVGAFYFDGSYSLLSAGVNFGAAYTWNRNDNISSVGVYLGPQSSQKDGVTSTSINIMTYLDLYKTSAGNFGVGIGYKAWESGRGFKAPRNDTSYLALGYKF